MKLNIPRDQLLNPIPPRVFLCTAGKKRICELPAANRSLTAKWNSYGELQLEVQRTYVDLIDGETKVHPAYDKVEAPRNVLLDGVSYFVLQDIDDTSSDNDIKSISAFSLEYATSNKYLTNWHINTGEVDSKEVLYNEEMYGIDYNTDADSFYKLASGTFDPSESYYQKVYSKQGYSETNPYVYEQVQVNDAQEYNEMVSNNNKPDAQPHEKLYMRKFANVQFYSDNPNKRGLSLLHLIFENIPEWKIGNVDQSLWRKERKFSEDRISVYDFIQNNLHDTFGCVAVWNSLDGTVSFYEELEDDAEEQSEASTRFETDVFISKDNLASEIKVNYSSDNIKTKLVVTGSDDLNIREVNLGRNEIMDLSFYHNLDWMEPDLYEAYNKYLETLQEAETGLNRYGLPSKDFPMSYPDAMKGWVAANNSYTDIMNAVPVEGNVVLVGDEFKKLYCIQSPADTAYCKDTINDGTTNIQPTDLYIDIDFKNQIPMPTNTVMYVVQGVLFVYNTESKYFTRDNSMLDIKKATLIDKLNLYHVDDDTEANKQDNILLKMKNASSDVATVRIYDKRKVASEYEDGVDYYLLTDSGKYEDITTIKNASDFNDEKDKYGDKLYTNDYYIQSIVTYASSGTSGEVKSYPILDWIKGELTTSNKMNDLKGYIITYIGTMGAYFVLAKDETIPANLQEYGVRLLEEKHQIYTTLFQTQTEAMFSKEKAQCIVQDNQPEGDYKPGTRWLDTNSIPIKLMEYQVIDEAKNTKDWVVISEKVSKEDREEYENYQRYLDNYAKLQAVQKVLIEKKKQSEYSKDGHRIDNRSIDISSYVREFDDNEDGKIDEKDLLRYNGQLLEANMENVAVDYLKELTGKKHTVIRKEMNQTYPLYTFTTSYDPITYGLNTKEFNYFTQYYIKVNDFAYAPVNIDGIEVFNEYNGLTEDKKLYVITSGHVYAVYLQGTTPYVAYADSQGVYNMIMEYIRDNTEMNKFFTVDQWIGLSPFIKEDEFNDSNFFLTEYDSEEEKQRITKELMEAASKELKTLCKPSLEFSMTMANILALPEFEPLFDQFQLGNFIKVGIREGYVKRARLLEVNINFDDLSNFNCTFGNLVTTKSEIDKHTDLLKTAVIAGKQVAKSSGSWQRAVDKTNKLEEDIANGLKDAAIAIGSASGQAISWDSTGMHFRKYKEGSTTEYEPEEIAIINNALVATNDSWQTSKASFGKYIINGEERWGPIAEYITAQTIEGKFIKGGSIQIGDETKENGSLFVVNEDGSVEIRSGGKNYLDAIKEIDEAYRLRVELEYSGSTIFTEPGQSLIITCKVFYSEKEVTTFPVGTIFKWIRKSNGNDDNWNKSHTYTDINTITITNNDIEKNAQFHCICTIDETKLT